MALYRTTVRELIQNNKFLPFLKLCQINLRSSSACHTNLKEILEEKIEVRREVITKFRKEAGKKVIGEITVNQVYGGARGITSIVWETSLVDYNKGIKIRGYSIPKLEKLLPKAEGGQEMLPEGIFWLMATGDIPTVEQVKGISNEWAERSKLPEHVSKFLKNVPKSQHPMCQLSCAIALLNHDSQFVKAYRRKVKKFDFWKHTYEDVMTLIANINTIAAIVYMRTYRDGHLRAKVDPNMDWAYNYCKMIGADTPEFIECMRMYFSIHCDHEGGNVSAHAANTVGSALADVFLSFAAGLNGLAGPLHGLANQESLQWILQMQREVGDDPSDEDVRAFIKKTLKTAVIPGFGHAILRQTDPRYDCQVKFAERHMPDDPIFKLVKQLYKIVPLELKALGKVQNPWPNVDAASGSLLYHYGMKETEYYTVLFGVARSLGVNAQAIWSRALLFPIERPKSATTIELMRLVDYKPTSCRAKC